MRRRYSYFMFQRSLALFFILPALYGAAAEYSIADEGKSVLGGKVTDMEGRAVEGAMVFVYNSPMLSGRRISFQAAPIKRDCIA